MMNRNDFLKTLAGGRHERCGTSAARHADARDHRVQDRPGRDTKLDVPRGTIPVRLP
jgi:hypothetical protein